MISSRTVARIILVTVAILAALYVLYLVREVLAALLVAVFLAVALGPAVDLVERARVPRALAILIVYLGILLAIFGIGLLVVPPIVDGVNRFVADVPGYVEDIRNSETLRRYDDRFGITHRLAEQAQTLPERLGDAAGALRSVTVGLFSAVFQVVTVLVMAFFLLLDGRRMVEFGLRQVPRAQEPRLRAIAGNVYHAVGGYVAGALTIALIAGTSTYLVLAILGIGLAIPLAVLMGFLVLIPLVGATIGGLVIAIVTGLEDFPTALIVWGVFVVLYQQVENNVLQPLIYRRTVSLHPLLVIVAVLIGAGLLGVLGALLAIPVAATLQILVTELWRLRAGAPDVDAGSVEQPHGDAAHAEEPGARVDAQHRPDLR